MKAVRAKFKFEEENRQNPLNTNSLVYFKQTGLFTEKLPRICNIHTGNFRGRAVWAESVSPWVNPISSRDQVKPIRIEASAFTSSDGWGN